MDDEGDLFEVECLLDTRKKEGKRYYKVRWNGFPPEEDTWEPEENVLECTEVLDAFWEKKKKIANKQRKRNVHSMIDNQRQETSDPDISTPIPVEEGMSGLGCTRQATKELHMYRARDQSKHSEPLSSQEGSEATPHSSESDYYDIIDVNSSQESLQTDTKSIQVNCQESLDLLMDDHQKNSISNDKIVISLLSDSESDDNKEVLITPISTHFYGNSKQCFTAEPNHQSPTPNHQSPTPNHQSPTPNYQSPTPNHQFATSNHQSPTPNHQSPTPNHQSTTPNHQSPTPNHQSTTPNHQSTTSNHQSPTPNHQSPTPNHQSPTPNHQSPTPNHQSPTLEHQSPVSASPVSTNKQDESTYDSGSLLRDAEISQGCKSPGKDDGDMPGRKARLSLSLKRTKRKYKYEYLDEELPTTSQEHAQGHRNNLKLENSYYKIQLENLREQMAGLENSKEESNVDNTPLVDMCSIGDNIGIVSPVIRELTDIMYQLAKGKETAVDTEQASCNTKEIQPNTDCCIVDAVKTDDVSTVDYTQTSIIPEKIQKDVHIPVVSVTGHVELEPVDKQKDVEMPEAPSSHSSGHSRVLEKTIEHHHNEREEAQAIKHVDMFLDTDMEQMCRVPEQIPNSPQTIDKSNTNARKAALSPGQTSRVLEKLKLLGAKSKRFPPRNLSSLIEAQAVSIDEDQPLHHATQSASIDEDQPLHHATQSVSIDEDQALHHATQSASIDEDQPLHHATQSASIDEDQPLHHATQSVSIDEDQPLHHATQAVSIDEDQPLHHATQSVSIDEDQALHHATQSVSIDEDQPLHHATQAVSIDEDQPLHHATQSVSIDEDQALHHATQSVSINEDQPLHHATQSVSIDEDQPLHHATQAVSIDEDQALHHATQAVSIDEDQPLHHATQAVSIDEDQPLHHATQAVSIDEDQALHHATQSASIEEDQPLHHATQSVSIDDDQTLHHATQAVSIDEDQALHHATQPVSIDEDQPLHHATQAVPIDEDQPLHHATQAVSIDEDQPLHHATQAVSIDEDQPLHHATQAVSIDEDQPLHHATQSVPIDEDQPLHHATQSVSIDEDQPLHHADNADNKVPYEEDTVIEVKNKSKGLSSAKIDNISESTSKNKGNTQTKIQKKQLSKKTPETQEGSDGNIIRLDDQSLNEPNENTEIQTLTDAGSDHVLDMDTVQLGEPQTKISKPIDSDQVNNNKTTSQVNKTKCVKKKRAKALSPVKRQKKKKVTNQTKKLDNGTACVDSENRSNNQAVTKMKKKSLQRSNSSTKTSEVRILAKQNSKDMNYNDISNEHDTVPCPLARGDLVGFILDEGNRQKDSIEHKKVEDKKEVPDSFRNEENMSIDGDDDFDLELEEFPIENLLDEDMCQLRDIPSPPVSPIDISFAAVKQAIREGDEMIVRAALAGELELDILDGASGMSLLMLASTAGQDSIVELLLRRHADVNAVQRNGMTALMHACEQGCPETAHVLLMCGADINRQQITGEMALIKACKKGHTDVVEVLLKHGADTKLETKSGHTAYQLALPSPYEEIQTLLEEHEKRLVKAVEKAIGTCLGDTVSLCKPALYSYRCISPREGQHFTFPFLYTSTQPGKDVVLFCIKANFTDDTMLLLFGEDNGVRGVLLNNKTQIPMLHGVRSIFSLEPRTGQNTVTIQTHKANVSSKLLLCIYSIQAS